MVSTLDRYHEKRKFDSTPEPQDISRREPRRRRGKALHFVIQKHAASHLHYDFRLELNGALKSWAVPKGPSLDPKDKRMAVQVEDHPLSYADFEGTIPKGNYGAGTVIVWDRGEWIPLDDPEQGYAAGKLKFELRGTKLAGIWNLVRTRLTSGSKENWLLIKHPDAAARPIAEFDIVAAQPDSVLSDSPKTRARSKTKSKETRRRTATTTRSKQLPPAAVVAPQPLALSPQLATLADAVPTGGDWLFELKFDGYRILARVDTEGDVHLFTRNGNDWTKKLPDLKQALEKLKLRACWLDGEIIATNAQGLPSFQALQNMFETGAARKGVATAAHAVQYFLFDLPYYDGHDLSAVGLQQRRELLQTLIPSSAAPTLQFSVNFEAPIQHLLTKACDLKLEGLIGKRANSPYHAGRNRDWIKLKCKQRQKFVIGGYTDSTSSARGLGAILLGVHEADGKLRYAGKVGTGFTQQSLLSLRKKLQPLLIDASPFDINRPPERAVHWVKPKLLAEVEFAEWTNDGHIRHASFQGLRDDKSPRAITQEKPLAAAGTLVQKKVATRKRNNAEAIAEVQISHTDRVVDPDSGATKGDVATYYASIADWLLPQLDDRPLSVIRAPRGVGGQLFFQKHKDSLRIPQLKELPLGLLPGHPPLIEVDSMEAVLGCAQMNVIEFHTWNAHVKRIEQPDRMLFDLDPGEGVEWNTIVDGALLMKALLDKLSLRSFLKTSGGKGLHIVVPLTPGKDWDTVKDFSAAVARHMAATLPQLFVAKSGPKNRINKIFIDYLRNGRAATTVAAFSLRARPGMGISMPMDWAELHQIESSAHWHIGNVDAGVAAQQMRSWQRYSSTQQTLTKAMRALGYRTEH